MSHEGEWKAAAAKGAARRRRALIRSSLSVIAIGALVVGGWRGMWWLDNHDKAGLYEACGLQKQCQIELTCMGGIPNHKESVCIEPCHSGALCGPGWVCVDVSVATYDFSFGGASRTSSDSTHLYCFKDADNPKLQP
jgi:hypothetical protein